jgi:hypothetical protein
LRTQADLSYEPQAASARLIVSALDLARAEGALALVHVREVAVRAIGALLATIVGAAFAQIAIVLAVLSPLLREVLSTTSLVIAVSLPGLLALACGWAAIGAWRGITREPASSDTAVRAVTEETPSAT